MKQITQLCKVAFASVLLLAGSLTCDGLPSHAAAQQATTRSDVKKWEYCSVTHTLSSKQDRTYYVAQISYHRPAGAQQENFESIFLDEAMSKALAKLGEDGWEMTGVAAFSFSDSNGYGTPKTTLYFKRPK